MAPSLAKADEVYAQAVGRLRTACILLERHLPSVDPAEVEAPQDPPPLRPSQNVIVTACPDCERELADRDSEDEQEHHCTHGWNPEAEDNSQREAMDTPTVRVPRRGHPNPGVIRMELTNLDTKFEVFAGAISTLISVHDMANQRLFERHLTVWTEYYGWMKDRAEDLINLIETANTVASNTLAHVQLSNTTSQAGSQTGQPGNSNLGQTQILSGSTVGLGGTSGGDQDVEVDVQNEDTGGQSGQGSSQNNGENVQTGVRFNGESEDFVGTRPNINGHYASTNLALALASMNHLSDAIDKDIKSVEDEINVDGSALSESYVKELKEFCSDIQKRIDVEFKDSAEKLARLDQGSTSTAIRSLKDSRSNFSDRLRVVQTTLRRASGSASAIVTERSVSNVSSGSTESTTGYKPFIERIKPPTFSGKVEDWPEFRCMWKDLLVDLPDSIQVQHIKSHVPQIDAKRITGLKTMNEVWERLERVYGDVELNIVTVKSNLEALVPKATLDHKRVQEVFEAVEIAVAQLTNLKAVQHIKEDFALMNKIVMKLPTSEQIKYTDYITSESIAASPSSRWDKFWAWLKLRHKSAVQTGLLFMCDKSGHAKSSSGVSSKSGVTCNSCGGIGHFSRSCPTKTSLSRGPTVKVNIAVSKITTKSEYDQYLPDTKKQIGTCPSCKQGPHCYTRDFPFGKAEWPSNRLDACPKFNGMNSRERGQLVEKLKACYKCLCWKHQGEACYTRSRSNCNVQSSGSACGGIHHKLLHGSGVAFCHKVDVKIASTKSGSVVTGRSMGSVYSTGDETI